MSSGNYIRDRRKEKGLTQEDLAELAGCNVRTVRRLETEGCAKETNTIKKILEILEVRTSRIENKGKLVLKFEADDDDNEEILNELGCNNSNEVFNTLKNNLIQAYQLVERKNYYEALEIYLAVSKLFVNEKIQLKVAILYYNMGRYEECIDASDKLINGQSYIYEGLNIKGICLSKLGKYEESLEILKEALEIKGYYIDYYNLGVTYGIKGDTYKAIKQYKKCLEINPNHARAHLNISICYFTILSINKSLYHVEEAIRLNPDMYEAYAIKGECYRFLDDLDYAADNFKLCLDKDPQNYSSIIGMCIISAVKNELIEGTGYFKELFKLYSDNFFKTDKDKSLIVDIGYKRITIVQIEKISKYVYKIKLGDDHIEIKVDSEGSFIYIGCLPISDETGTILYPTIGKAYTDKYEYDKCIEGIERTIEVFKASQKYPLHVNFRREIEVILTELEDCVKIEIIFGCADKYKIVSYTDTKGQGLEGFIEFFNKYNQFRIQVEYLDKEAFIIDCIENVIINRIKSENCTYY